MILFSTMSVLTYFMCCSQTADGNALSSLKLKPQMLAFFSSNFQQGRTYGQQTATCHKIWQDWESVDQKSRFAEKCQDPQFVDQPSQGAEKFLNVATKLPSFGSFWLKLSTFECTFLNCFIMAGIPKCSRLLQ